MASKAVLSFHGLQGQFSRLSGLSNSLYSPEPLFVMHHEVIFAMRVRPRHDRSVKKLICLCVHDSDDFPWKIIDVFEPQTLPRLCSCLTDVRCDRKLRYLDIMSSFLAAGYHNMHPSGLTFIASPFNSLHCYADGFGSALTGRGKFERLCHSVVLRRQRICASVDAKETQHNMGLRESLPLELPKPDLAADEAAAAAQALLDDLADRPEYYLNISGVLLGITLSCIVLSATMVALESIPFIPDVLRMIGLAYLFWFLNKFLFSAVERERLGDEVSVFVRGVRGGDVSKLEQVEDA